MRSRLHGRGRVRAMLFAFILVLGLLPFGAATANSNRTATHTEITFDASLINTIMTAEGWVDAAGIVRVRDQVSHETVSGDINGEAEITFSADFVPDASCDADDLLNCTTGELTGWGSIAITDETGRWDGDIAIGVFAAEGAMPEVYGKLIAAGRGGNAGKSIVADVGLGEGDDIGAATFGGFMLTMAKPAFGINLNSMVCFDEEFNAFGAFVSNGAIESSGAAEADFFATDGPWTYRYGVHGESTFTDDQGSLTIEFTGMAQDSADTKVDWGHWVITGGTGAYENAFGHGKVTGYVGDFAQCSLGEGVSLQYLGEVHFN